MSLQTYSRPSSAGHFDLIVAILPGGFQNYPAPATFFKLAPVVGIGYGWSWK